MKKLNFFFQALSLVSLLASEMPSIVSDGKVTVEELMGLAIKLARKLGYDVSEEGFDVSK
jgi:hypothetical protein